MSGNAVCVLGGTFDPVHNAHLAMAAAAVAALHPAKLLWIPTGRPGYRHAPVADARHRVAMLRLATAGETRYAIDERELSPGVSGYTFDTLSGLRRELGAGTPLVLLMGADQHAAIETWHRWRELSSLAQIAVCARPGMPLPQGVALIPMQPMDISASTIREGIAAGKDVSGLVPHAVLDYISANQLYR
jgi:nicotinate-nucleotide adenylyltransferase